MSDLLIDKVEIIGCSDLVDPGDDTRVVAVHAAGFTGWYGPVSAPAAAFVDRRLAPLIVGTSAADHDRLLAILRRGLGPPLGVLTSWAIGALDCAVWDLHARAQARPVAALLAPSKIRTHVPAYASWLRLDIREPANVETVARVAAQGWLFTKWGLRRDDDLDKGDDAARMARATRRVVEAIGAPAAFDALCTWDLALSLCFAEQVDHAQTVWLEEPLTSYDLEPYATLAASCPPLALGERMQISDEHGALLGLPGLGAFTLDVVGCGGLTAAVGALAAATAAGVRVYPHGRSLVPAVHLAAAFPDAVAAIEYQLSWEPRRQHLFTDPIECGAGQITVPSTPGLGPIPRRL